MHVVCGMGCALSVEQHHASREAPPGTKENLNIWENMFHVSRTEFKAMLAAFNLEGEGLISQHQRVKGFRVLAN